MYKLYWTPDAGSLAPQIILEEAGAEYEICEIDLDAEEENSEEFLKVNPRGQIPALTLPDGTTITESAAIVLHVAENYPESNLLPPLGSSERATVYRWLMFAATNYYEGILRYFYPYYFTTEEAHQDSVKSSAVAYTNKARELIEDAIGDGPYLLGETYSVVDPYILMLSGWIEEEGSLFPEKPKLKHLCETVKQRPAVQRIWAANYPEG
ncbi:MAG: glutathione S-transferase N-terminal domain-containing protein [Pseudomonadota bacterium]